MCHKIAKKIIIWCEKDQEFDGYEHIKAVYGIEVFLESFWKLVGLLLLGCLAENRQMFFRVNSIHIGNRERDGRSFSTNFRLFCNCIRRLSEQAYKLAIDFWEQLAAERWFTMHSGKGWANIERFKKGTS